MHRSSSPGPAPHPAQTLIPCPALYYLAHLVVHVLVNVNNGGLVAAAVAVVWRAEHRDDRALVLPQEAFRHKLMRADNEL